MFKKERIFKRILVLLIAAVFLMSLSVMSASADPGDDGGVDVGEDGAAIIDDGGGDNNDGGDVDQGQVDNGYGNDDYDIGDDGNNYDDGNNGGYDAGNNNDGNDSQSNENQDGQNVIDEIREKYINGIDDLRDKIAGNNSTNEKTEELPEVDSNEVIETMAEPLPDVEVSDATLFSGIIMWLCVAVGISVVAGVMVSKRTHRKSA